MVRHSYEASTQKSQPYCLLSPLARKTIYPRIYYDGTCISYVTYVRYVAGINHEARGREGRMIYSGNVPNGRDITNLCRHEPVVMAKGAKIPVLSRKNRFVTGQ